MSIPNVSLNNGVQIPQVGFGVFLVPESETKAAVAHALQAGYRHLDTAKLYQNEAEVGAAIAESGIARDELFVTTKVWNSEQGFDPGIESFEASLDRLGLDVLDLLLIHWPAPDLNRYVDTWNGFEKLYADGRVRAIGVSNFAPEHLRRLFDETSVVPAVNQIELHPLLPQTELRALHAEHGIVTEAWSPLARGGPVLGDPVITEIAGRLGKSAAQVVLRWHLELGNVIIPKSVTPSRIAENLELFDFTLTAADVAAISGLETGDRIGPNPLTFSRT
ncbi:MAG: aldo/keto reductase [Actinomycetota bacterium]|nr:aldo/keto reductase [Actinomycetota bacterium]MDQ2956768.1 aldo/keto reductase [Actinomycetota bacterium]